MTSILSRTAIGVLLATALGATAVQAQEAWARVISATPLPESTGNIRYNVTYEYGGRQYTTQMDSRPGAQIAVQANAYGVTTAPIAPQARFDMPGSVAPPSGAAPWEHVTPEPGVVLSAGGPAAPAYAQPVPMYGPAPVYVQPAYGYAQPYLYPPVGISLNLGYSRGWGGGGWHGGHRGWRR